MELTVNLFSKGLQIDTHPMVLDNNTLSDALNATFVTMNGNEVILQNDMGNRRIDNAFLPAGYQPLGMKEYGGVIYVAAYNPLTNRGLIGSFPSPLRKIDISGNGGILDLDEFISKSTYIYDLDFPEDPKVTPESDENTGGSIGENTGGNTGGNTGESTEENTSSSSAPSITQLLANYDNLLNNIQINYKISKNNCTKPIYFNYVIYNSYDVNIFESTKELFYNFDTEIRKGIEYINKAKKVEIKLYYEDGTNFNSSKIYILSTPNYNQEEEEDLSEYETLSDASWGSVLDFFYNFSTSRERLTKGIFVYSTEDTPLYPNPQESKAIINLKNYNTGELITTGKIYKAKWLDNYNNLLDIIEYSFDNLPLLLDGNYIIECPLGAVVDINYISKYNGESSIPKSQCKISDGYVFNLYFKYSGGKNEYTAYDSNRNVYIIDKNGKEIIYGNPITPSSGGSSNAPSLSMSNNFPIISIINCYYDNNYILINFDINKNGYDKDVFIKTTIFDSNENVLNTPNKVRFFKGTTTNLPKNLRYSYILRAKSVKIEFFSEEGTNFNNLRKDIQDAPSSTGNLNNNDNTEWGSLSNASWGSILRTMWGYATPKNRIQSLFIYSTEDTALYPNPDPSKAIVKIINYNTHEEIATGHIYSARWLDNYYNWQDIVEYRFDSIPELSHNINYEIVCPEEAIVDANYIARYNGNTSIPKSLCKVSDGYVFCLYFLYKGENVSDYDSYDNQTVVYIINKDNEEIIYGDPVISFHSTLVWGNSDAFYIPLVDFLKCYHKSASDKITLLYKFIRNYYNSAFYYDIISYDASKNVLYLKGKTLYDTDFPEGRLVTEVIKEEIPYILNTKSVKILIYDVNDVNTIYMERYVATQEFNYDDEGSLSQLRAPRRNRINRALQSLGESNSSEVYQVEKEYIILPISDKVVLHTGDKFSIYSGLILSILPYLTLPSDTKNNLFTFQVGIFNSLNEFIDITDKLKLWDIDNNGTLYHINKELGFSTSLTINDSNLLKARNKLAINTYSYKMSSPLYLKAILNHISNISYSIKGEKINSREVRLKIKVTYQYNCVDNIDNNKFKLIFNSIDSDRNIEADFIEENDLDFLYELNLYVKEITYGVTLNNLDENYLNGKKYYKYILKFPLLHNYEEWPDEIYIKSLNKKGAIDLSKINSDIIKFKGYRYFNNIGNKTTTLEVNLESYPKETSKLYIYIEAGLNSSPNSNKIEIGKIEDPGTGVFTYTFSYQDLKLEDRECYYLSFTKKDKNNLLTGELLDDNRNHLYITTEIFNGNYIGKKFLSLEDRSNLYDENGYLKYYYDNLKDIYIEDFSVILKLYLSPVLKYNISSDVEESVLDVTGNYIFPVNYLENEATYKVNESWNIINTLNLSVTVNNPEIYPKEIDTSLDVGTGENQLKITRVLERTLGGEKITETGNNSNKYYYGDEELFDKSNTSHTLSSDDGHIINILNLGEILDKFNNLLKLRLKSIISVNNILKGSLVEKTIFCEHVITSFWSFIRKHYYGTTLDRVLIKNPYFCLDYEGLNLATITYTEELTHVNDLKDLNEGHPRTLNLNGKKSDNSYIEEIARDHISDFINEKSNGNLLAIEISTDDVILGYLPCVLDYNLSGFSGKFIGHGILNNFFNSSEILPAGPGICGFRSFRRIWLKVNKLEYIPIFITCNKNTEGTNLGDSNEVVTYMYDDNRLHNLLQHIPHYYEYESGGKTLPEKVFNTTNYSKTKEFELDSVITVNVLGKALLISSTNIFKLDSNLKISENITFKEGIIHSNSDFEEDFDNINNYKISCAVMDGDYDNHILYIKDCNGKYFDSLYIYYDDNECFSYNKSFKPSYIPEKFYVEELGQYMPELKSSRKLYAGKNGENTLINEYVYPYESARNNFKQNGYRIYYYGSEILFITGTTEFPEYDITSKQYEGGNLEGNSNRFLPLRTKNIFDRTYILGYGLTSENISNNIERLKLD